MSGRRLGVLLASGVLAALIALTSSACSGGQEGQNSAKGERGDEANANTAKVNPLVGTWRRVRKCEEQVRLMKESGLDELIPERVSPSEFSNAASAQGSPPPGRPCKGAGDGRLPHDHVFYKDGRFASVDDQGQFVDHGRYKFVDDRTIVFDDPPGNLVRFRFSDDRNTVTFDVTIPDMDECSQRCRTATAYRLAVFYPGLPWKRVPEKDLWPGEV
jgi:hypothetical protein